MSHNILPFVSFPPQCGMDASSLLVEKSCSSAMLDGLFSVLQSPPSSGLDTDTCHSSASSSSGALQTFDTPPGALPPDCDMAVHLSVPTCSTMRQRLVDSDSPGTPRHRDGRYAQSPLHPLGISRIEQSPAQQPKAASSVAPEIELVWPVCLSLGGTGSKRCSLDIVLAPELPQQQVGAAIPVLQNGGDGCMVLVATGAAMDLVASASVGNDGLARCKMPLAHLLRSGQSRSDLLASPAPRNSRQGSRASMRMLTLFTAASSGSAESGGVDDGCGAAVSVLCAPPEVAAELHRLFLQMAGKLLALENDPHLPHLQMRDVHGFIVLPGLGSLASRCRNTLFSSSAPKSIPEASVSESAAIFQLGQQQKQRHMFPFTRGTSSDLSSGSSAAPMRLDGPPWLASPAERRACARTWSKHFQPLLREISHLLTCVPGALPFEQLGGWDQHTYCKTLAGLVAFLEHHACWSTLSALLRHAGRFGVVLCYLGSRVDEPTGPALHALLQGARHEDISVQYLPNEQQQRLHASAMQVVDLMDSSSDAEDDDDWFQCTCDPSASPALRISGPGEQDDDTPSGSTGDDNDVDDAEVLASEFSNWRERWLTQGFAGTLDKIANSPASQSGLATPSQTHLPRPNMASGVAGYVYCPSSSAASAMSDHGSTSREVFMLLLACAAVALYAMWL